MPYSTPQRLWMRSLPEFLSFLPLLSGFVLELNMKFIFI
jgi:hypothetical protein